MGDFINEIDALIRAGKSADARKALIRYRPRALGRRRRFELATLARRAGLPMLTLRLLGPVVRPPATRVAHASAEERAEYAAALVRIGAAREAVTMLRAIDVREAPQTDLFLSHALFTQWKYHDAIPALRRFIAAPIDDYQRLVGYANLSAALVHERLDDEAEKNLLMLKGEARGRGLTIIYGNALERLGELSILRRDWKAAEAYLREAANAVAQAGGFDALFVEKWHVVMGLLRGKPGALPELARFRAKARENQHWETVRECDAHRAIALKEPAGFRHVYFGTPYADYRRWFEKAFGARVEIPDTYVWLVRSGRGGRALDLLCSHPDLKFGQLKHRTLQVLSSDFYRPFPVAHLFSELYHGEPLNLRGAAARVHEGVRDLRAWLRRKRVPLAITEDRGQYRLVGTEAGVRLIIPSTAWWERCPLAGVQNLRARARGAEFSAADAAKWLGVARRTAFGTLRDAVEKGLLEKMGAGPATRYRFVSAG